MTPDQKTALFVLLQDQERIAVKAGGLLEFHHGDCVGADAEAHAIADENNAYIVVHPPSNPKSRAFVEGYGVRLLPRPYLERNHAIVDSTDLLIATPKQTFEVRRSGTWATVRYARDIGRAITILYP